jgi:hypothetical protein
MSRKNEIIESMAEQMAWYGFKDGEHVSRKKATALARQIYREVKTKFPAATPDEIKHHWECGAVG